MKNIITISAATKPPLKKGQIYRHIEECEYYILAQVATDYVLVCLNDGNFWTTPKKSMEDAFGHSRGEFVLIRDLITLTPSAEE